jgi:alkanesulfonate monooxygenase SsuD/methylene tetrahydromethanopterin reductase-like flavin-dependent oxidoreductase (luciferase family)
MEIGVGLPTNLRGTNKDLVLEWSRRAENAGFSSLCMGERLTYAGYDWVLALTAAASVTSRIRLLSNVIILPIHPPGVVAKQSLSLDDFSGGRFSLGVGLGTPLDDYDVAPHPRAGRGVRFEESLRALRELWKGESLIEGVREIGPRPVREGGPEILIGANGPKALRRVGEFGDGAVTWSFGADPVEARGMFDIVESSWEEFGREGRPRLVCGCYFAAGAKAAADLEAYFRDYYPNVLPGQVESLLKAVRTVTPDAIREVVKQFSEIGCDEFIFVPVTPDLAHLDGLAGILADELKAGMARS